MTLFKIKFTTERWFYYSLILLFLLSCKQYNSDWVQQTSGRSILDLEYINDSLDIVIKDIRIREIEPNRFLLDIYVFTEQHERYSDNHHFYVHFYPKKAKEKGGDFLSVVTKEVSFKRKVLVYSGELKTKNANFELMRYGLVDADGKRLFTLAVETVAIR